MNALCSHSLFRLLATIVAFGAWLVLSNHCALTELTAQHPPTHGCCAAQPAQDPAPCPDMPHGCCKSLKVALPDDAKIPAASFAALPPVFVALIDAALAGKCSAEPVCYQPPDSPSFAELILHRSLHSHAPPARS